MAFIHIPKITQPISFDPLNLQPELSPGLGKWKWFTKERQGLLYVGSTLIIAGLTRNVKMTEKR